MQFSKEDVAYLNICSDLLIDKIIEGVLKTAVLKTL